MLLEILENLYFLKGQMKMGGRILRDFRWKVLCFKFYMFEGGKCIIYVQIIFLMIFFQFEYFFVVQFYKVEFEKYELVNYFVCVGIVD